LLARKEGGKTTGGDRTGFGTSSPVGGNGPRASKTVSKTGTRDRAKLLEVVEEPSLGTGATIKGTRKGGNVLAEATKGKDRGLKAASLAS